MRISDWSSDVCSSDLTAASAFNAAETSTERAAGPKLSNSKFMAGLARLRRRQKGYRSPSQPLRLAPSSGDQAALRQGRTPGELTNYPPFAYQQIGRASGRERFCLYVYIPVFSLSLKKKTHHDN